jgi:hypothetical protein
VFDAALVKEVLAREEADAQAKALEDKARQDKAQKLREQQMVSQAHISYIYTPPYNCIPITRALL